MALLGSDLTSKKTPSKLKVTISSSSAKKCVKQVFISPYVTSCGYLSCSIIKYRQGIYNIMIHYSALSWPIHMSWRSLRLWEMLGLLWVSWWVVVSSVKGGRGGRTKPRYREVHPSAFTRSRIPDMIVIRRSEACIRVFITSNGYVNVHALYISISIQPPKLRNSHHACHASTK